jgi:hypothetical protein
MAANWLLSLNSSQLAAIKEGENVKNKKSKEKALIKKAIEEAERRKKRKEREWRQAREMADRAERILSQLWKKGYIRPGKPEEYAEWLRAFLLGGGKITKVEERNLPSGFFVAQKSFKLPPGPSDVGIVIGGYTHTLRLLVPKGLKVEHDGTHYAEIFPFDYSEIPWTVPLFADVKKILLSE